MSSTEADPVLAAIAQDWANWKTAQLSNPAAKPDWQHSTRALANALNCGEEEFVIKSVSKGNFSVRLNETLLNPDGPRFVIMACDQTVNSKSPQLTNKPIEFLAKSKREAVLTFCSAEPPSHGFRIFRLTARESSSIITAAQSFWPNLQVEILNETQFLHSALVAAAQLQYKYSNIPNSDMELRHAYLDQARERLDEGLAGSEDLKLLRTKVNNGDGRPAMAPYIRIFDPAKSPNASTGYFVCMFVKGDGRTVSISLQHAATFGHQAAMANKMAEEVAAHSQVWFETLSIDSKFGPILKNLGANRKLDLTNKDGKIGDKQKNYPHSNIASVTYPIESLPQDDVLIGVIGQFSEIATHLNQVSTAPFSTSAVLAQVAEAIHWSEHRVADLLESLTDSSPQIVLAGPPGTGKTYVSRWIASALLGSPGELDDPRISLVQFHPTYGYEDFVEGLRPVSRDGAVVFETVPGPIVRLAQKIQDDDEPRVLIIDEINRANIPRVFGELMYLLEYRNQSMDLMLEPNFVLPSKLHIIATMNTADKSTRVMDVAMRRRFDFFQLDPDVEVLKAHYADGHWNELGDELFQGFVSLNNRLMEDLDKHRLIGHSYFMTDHMDAQVLRARWDRQIAPLLEEYFYERQVQDDRYRMSEFWPSATSA
jgi:hypothetical protein